MPVIEIDDSLQDYFDDIAIDNDGIAKLLSGVGMSEQDIDSLKIYATTSLAVRRLGRLGLKQSGGDILGEYYAPDNKVRLALATIRRAIQQKKTGEQEYNVTLVHELGHAAAHRLGVDYPPTRLMPHFVNGAMLVTSVVPALKVSAETRSLSLGIGAGVASLLGSGILANLGLDYVDRAAAPYDARSEEIANRFADKFAPEYPELISVVPAVARGQNTLKLAVEGLN